MPKVQSHIFVRTIFHVCFQVYQPVFVKMEKGSLHSAKTGILWLHEKRMEKKICQQEIKYLTLIICVQKIKNCLEQFRKLCGPLAQKACEPEGKCVVMFLYPVCICKSSHGTYPHCAEVHTCTVYTFHCTLL